MLARLLPPRENYSGNLLWNKEELPAVKECIDRGIEELRKLKYWASPFPEGDGITFSWAHGEKSSEMFLADFLACFPELEIELGTSKDSNQELADLTPINTLLPCTVIVPIAKVFLETTVLLGEYDLRCRLEFDREPETRLTEIEGEYLQFDAHLQYKHLLQLGRGIDCENAVINHCLDLAESAMDIIRFQFSSFTRPEFTPNPAGQLDDGTYAVEIIPATRTHLKPMSLRGISRPLAASNNWLGPEVENFYAEGRGRLVEILEGRNDQLSLNIKVALRLCRQAFYTIGDESRFLSLVFALDGLLAPGKDCSGWKQRVYVASIISDGSAITFEKKLERYDELYTDVRNSIVHRGADFYSLGYSSKECCQDIYDYIKIVIEIIEKYDLSTVDELYAKANAWAGSQGYIDRTNLVVSRAFTRRGKGNSTFKWTPL